MGDVAIHPGRHKEGPREGHGTMQLMLGSPGAAGSAGKGPGCESRFGSPGCRGSCQR